MTPDAEARVVEPADSLRRQEWVCVAVAVLPGLLDSRAGRDPAGALQSAVVSAGIIADAVQDEADKRFGGGVR